MYPTTSLYWKVMDQRIPYYETEKVRSDTCTQSKGWHGMTGTGQQLQIEKGK